MFSIVRGCSNWRTSASALNPGAPDRPFSGQQGQSISKCNDRKQVRCRNPCRQMKCVSGGRQRKSLCPFPKEIPANDWWRQTPNLFRINPARVLYPEIPIWQGCGWNPSGRAAARSFVFQRRPPLCPGSITVFRKNTCLFAFRAGGYSIWILRIHLYKNCGLCRRTRAKQGGSASIPIRDAASPELEKRDKRFFCGRLPWTAQVFVGLFISHRSSLYFFRFGGKLPSNYGNRGYIELFP